MARKSPEKKSETIKKEKTSLESKSEKNKKNVDLTEFDESEEPEENESVHEENSEDEEEATLLCEVNSNAHFKNIFTCTGVNVAECMMEEIRRQCEKLDMRRKSAGSK